MLQFPGATEKMIDWLLEQADADHTPDQEEILNHAVEIAKQTVPRNPEGNPMKQRKLKKTYTAAQYNLNEELASTVTDEILDIKKVEELLKQGADPMGYYNDDEDCALQNLFAEAQSRKIAERLPAVIELFLQYGMDVDSSEWDVLHRLTWIHDEYGIQTLKLLMDSGLSAETAESFAIDLIGDILQLEAGGGYTTDLQFNDYTWGETLDYAARMVMLLASYKRVFNSSRYIREMVYAQKDEVDAFTQFRNWDEYRCEVTIRDYGDLYCEYTGEDDVSWILGSASVYEKSADLEIRRIRLLGYGDMEYLDHITIPDWD